MMSALSASDLAPDPSRLTLAPVFDNLPLVILAVAAIFLAVIILYFILRGKSQYS